MSCSRKMIKLLLLGLLAAASGAPHYHHRHSSPFSDGFTDFDIHPSFGEEFFDTSRFWQGLETQFRQMDQMLSEFHRRFPNTGATAGVVGNQYKVTIPLAGFDAEDIKVKAREGVLMIQAVHRTGEDIMLQHIDVPTLPSNVGVEGLWMFENNVLTVVFPMKGGITTEAPTHEIELVTNGPAAGSREEMEKANDNGDQDADIDIRKDSRESAIQTNEITASDATTHAVDLKNEVEFVPFHYK